MTDFVQGVADIRNRVMAAKATKAVVTPQQALRASGFHPCDRHMYYQVANWQDCAPVTPETQCLFDWGKLVERAVIDDLQEAGYEIDRQQLAMAVKVKGGTITGHLDGMIRGPGLPEGGCPLEIKGYTFVGQRVAHWRDFLPMPQPWLSAVPCQMQIYLLQANADVGVLCLQDKKSAQINPLPVELDYDYAESLLKRAEEIYQYISAEIPPDRISYQERLCADCRFAHICQPLQQYEPGIDAILDERLEELAATYWGTATLAKDHERAAHELKSFAKALGRSYSVADTVLELSAHERSNRTVQTVRIRRSNDESEPEPCRAGASC